MNELFYYSAASIGLMCILKYGSILSFLRTPLTARFNFFEELFDCSLCLGFWAGVVISLFIYNLSPHWDALYFLFPLISAPLCWTADSVMGIIKYKELALKDKIE